MTATVVKKLNTSFTGGNSAALPFFTHSAGVAGYAHRWLTIQQAGADGAAVAAVKPQTGTTDLTQATAAKQPIYAQSDGYKALRLDGVDDIIGGAMAGVKTITLLAKMTAPAGTAGGIMNTGPNVVRRTSENPPRVGVGIGANATQFFPVGAANAWHLFTLVADGATTGFYFNGAYTALAGTDANTGVTLGFYGASFGKMDALEVVTWDRALSAAECAAVHTALKSRYADLTIY